MGPLNESVSGARSDRSAEYAQRFQRAYGGPEVEITLELDIELRDTIALGNYAREALAGGNAGADRSYLDQLRLKSERTIDDVLGYTTAELVDTIGYVWQSVPAPENLRHSGLLNTLCEAREMLRRNLQEFDGSEKPGWAISNAIDETADGIKTWLRTPGRYDMRPRRIKAAILDDEQVKDVRAAMDELEEGSERWLQERAKLMESVYRLSRHIAINRFLLQGRLPNLVSVDDLASEAAEYTARRLASYDAGRGVRFSSWVTAYIDQFYSRRIGQLANPIHIPQGHVDALMTPDPASQIGVAKQINERSEGIRHLHSAWLALGRHILRLDGGDGPTDSDQFVTDPEGPPQDIGWQELLTEYHRLLSDEFHSGRLWPGHGQSALPDNPEKHFEVEDAIVSIRDVMEKLLDERLCRILALRFGLDDGYQRTLDEVGEAMNLTRERIRQLECRAISTLKHELLFNKRSRYYGQFERPGRDDEIDLGNYARHKGQPDFPEYVVGEAAHSTVEEEVREARRRRSGAVDPNLWEW